MSKDLYPQEQVDFATLERKILGTHKPITKNGINSHGLGPTVCGPTALLICGGHFVLCTPKSYFRKKAMTRSINLRVGMKSGLWVTNSQRWPIHQLLIRIHLGTWAGLGSVLVDWAKGSFPW